jgi:hypothetical protein
MFKNIGKNLREAAVGTVGGVAGIAFNHMVLSKVPKVKENHMVREGINGAIGLIMMDYFPVAGLGWTIGQGIGVVRELPLIKNYIGHHTHAEHGGGGGGGDHKDVVHGLNEQTSKALSELKTMVSGATMSSHHDNEPC